MTITTSTWKLSCAAVTIFGIGLGAGLVAARQTVSPSLYVAKPPTDAARASLDNLNGDRTRAEELFGRAFAKPTGNPYNVAKAAGSYVGVTPQ